MTIAVLDDGVNSNCYPSIGELAFDLRVNQKGSIVHRHRKTLPTPSHGTICAAIISKYAPDVEIGSIQVLQDENGRGNPNQLISALHWCSEQQISLIHMSLGSRMLRDVEPIRLAVQELMDSGSVVVAALTNTNRFSFPACMRGVIGVRKSSILEGDQYAPIEGGIFEVPFVASSRHELTDCNGKNQITAPCNSFAAPLISARVYALVQKEPGLSGLDCIERLGGSPFRDQERFLRTPFRFYSSSEVPVIQMIGKPQETLPLMQRLRAHFQKLGYNCLALSNTIIGETGIGKIPNDIPLPQYLGYLSQWLEPDLFLIFSPIVELADVSIHIHATLKNTHYRGVNIYMPAQVTDLVIGRIVRYLERQG